MIEPIDIASIYRTTINFFKLSMFYGVSASSPLLKLLLPFNVIASTTQIILSLCLL